MVSFLDRVSNSKRKYRGKPNFLILNNTLKDSLLVEGLDSRFRIQTKLVNNGERVSRNTFIRTFIVIGDSTLNMNFNKINSKLTISPNQEKIIGFSANLKELSINDFYYCVDIKFYDKLLNQEFIQTHFFHHHKGKEGLLFYDCSQTEIKRLKKVLQKEL